MTTRALRVILTHVQDTYFAIGLDEIERVVPFEDHSHASLLRLPTDTTPLASAQARKLAVLRPGAQGVALVLGAHVQVQNIQARHCVALPAWLMTHLPPGLHAACLTTSPLTWLVDPQALRLAHHRGIPCSSTST